MSEVSGPINSASGLHEKEFLDQVVQVYTTSVTTTIQIQKKCRAIQDFLEANKIDHKLIDMCMDLEARPRMLEIIPEEFKQDEDNKHLPPQVFAGDFEYCGSFDEFMDAREMDLIYRFFRLTPPEGTAEHKVAFPPLPTPEPTPEPSEADPEEQPEEQIEENDEEQIEEQTEQKEYDPEVSMGAGNIEDTQMFAAAMGEPIQEQTTKLEEQDGEVIELSVQASQRDEEESQLDVGDDEAESESGQQSVIDKNEMVEQEAE
jgi:hypothetical protein